MSLWDMADVVAPLAEQAKIPNLAIRWDPGVAEKFSYTITFETTYATYNRAVVDMLKSMDAHSIAILSEQTAGWVLGAEDLKRQAEQSGLKVLRDDQFIGGDTDVRSVVTRIVASKPDVIVLNSNPPNTAELVKTIRQLAPEQHVTGYFDTENPANVEGLTFVAQFDAAPWFKEKFKQRYGADYKVRAPQAYDIVKLLAAAQSSAAKKLDGRRIVDALNAAKHVAGASGDLVSNGKRTIESDCVRKIAKGGRFVHTE
jgi:ABC-type branched-subunit amino acid transport system substrate-binding protein